MKILPDKEFEQYTDVAVKILENLHVSYMNIMYSVPYRYYLSRAETHLHVFRNRIEVICDGNIVAVHPVKDYKEGTYVTVPDHMPSGSELEKFPWNGKRYISWASSVGPNTKDVICRLLASRPYEQQAYRSCMSILKLTDRYGKRSLEKACQSAALRSPIGMYKYIRSIIS